MKMRFPSSFKPLGELLQLRPRDLPWSILLFFLLSCGGGKQWQGDRSDPFDRSDDDLSPSFRLYHPASDSSVLFFRVSHEELLYTRNNASAPFEAELKVKVRVRDRNGQLLAVDSGYVRDEGKGDGGHTLGSLPLEWEEEVKRGRLDIRAKDTKRERETTGRLYFDRKGPNARQNFLPVHPKRRTPFFRNYFPKLERIGLRYERSDVREFHVRAYQRDFPLPPPPFASDGFHSFDHEADSLFSFSLDTLSDPVVPIPDSGFYHLQLDTSLGRKGFTLFRFREGYPNVKTVEAMLGPIRYLTSEEEFAELKEKEGAKAAVDSFWVAKGGSHERARKLIEAYYGRVENANRYFTTHVEGWKTDRGLIHIIFGKPETIERSSAGEKWIYGNGDGKMRLSFEFHRVENPFSTEDMSLERSSMYKRPWYQAVEAWRNGRIHSY